jgi:hypothetical protein
MKKTLFLCFALFFTSISILQATPAQVTIIANAEVDSSGNLTQQGLERAGALAPYFTLTPDLITFGLPVSIFAARPTLNTSPYPSGSDTTCCIGTVAPTAFMLSQPIHPGYAQFQEQSLADFINGDTYCDGANVLICWRPSSIAALAEAFGVSSPPDFGTEVNVTWVIQFSPTITLTIYPQRLIYGDNHPI